LYARLYGLFCIASSIRAKGLLFCSVVVDHYLMMRFVHFYHFCC